MRMRTRIEIEIGIGIIDKPKPRAQNKIETTNGSELANGAAPTTIEQMFSVALI